MRKTSLVFNRFISLLLSFLIGFFSFGGLLVGAGYIVYNYVSIDFLNKFGLGINTDSYFDKNAEVAIDSMTLKELLSEDLVSSVGDDLVCVHIRLRARAGLPDNERKMLQKTSVRYLVASGTDPFALFLGHFVGT